MEIKHKEMKKIIIVLKSKHPILCNVKIRENQKVIPKLNLKTIHDLSPRLNG